jgi:hypothetical protein
MIDAHQNASETAADRNLFRARVRDYMRRHSCRDCSEGLSDAMQMTDVLLMFLAMLGGPSLAGMRLTEIVEVWAGLSALLSRMGRWWANVRCYSVAFCTIPLLLLVLLFPLTLLVSSEYAPGVQIAGFAIGLAAGFFEELGWISFALPGMRARLSPLAAPRHHSPRASSGRRSSRPSYGSLSVSLP